MTLQSSGDSEVAGIIYQSSDQSSTVDGVDVTFDSTDSDFSKTGTVDGAYLFQGLPAEQFEVTVTDGSTETTSTVDLSSDERRVESFTLDDGGDSPADPVKYYTENGEIQIIEAVNDWSSSEGWFKNRDGNSAIIEIVNAWSSS